MVHFNPIRVAHFIPLKVVHLFPIQVAHLFRYYQVKPASVQDRLLRRILEKRQAQVNHRMSKVIVPEDLEPLNWEKDLDDYQKVCNFAS